MDKIKIKNYLTENPDVAVDVARELNSWDGSFPEFDCFYMSDMVDCMCCDRETTLKFLDDIISAAKDGEFNDYNDDSFIRYNDLGWLEVRTQAELEEEVIDNLDIIVDGLIDNYPQNVEPWDAGLKELLDEEEEEENDEE